LHKVYESVPIKLQLNDEEMALFAVHRYQFSGVDIRTRLARHYPLGERLFTPSATSAPSTNRT